MKTVLAAAVLALAGVAGAANIDYITAGDTWKYICTGPAVACPAYSGFEMPGFNDSEWLTGAAPFSNVTTGDFAMGTSWSTNFDPPLRKVFNLGTPVDMTAQIGVDNGYTLWVNGILISSANAEGFTSRWEYTVPVPGARFVSGANVVALRLEDHGSLTAFDMRLFGDESGQHAPIPEPSATTLVASGALAIAWLSRRLRRRA